jgi:C4-dicarboxylate-specific signal transduction histidine kinase
MVTVLLTTIAVAWSALVGEMLASTATADSNVVSTLGRTYEVSSSTRVWVVAAAAASVVLVWSFVAWATRRRRTHRFTEDEPAQPDAILLARVASMQLRVEELQDRLNGAQAERSELRAELRRLRPHDDLEPAAEVIALSTPPTAEGGALRARLETSGDHRPAPPDAQEAQDS